MKLFYLVLGGAAGTVSRYLLSAAIHESAGHGFPYGTLAVNSLGCLFIGFLSSWNDGHFFIDDNMKMLLAVGFCGAFTTFSTFILETAHLAKGEGVWHALANITLGLFAGVLAFIIGRRLGRVL